MQRLQVCWLQVTEGSAPSNRKAKVSSEAVPSSPAPFLYLESKLTPGADRGDKGANRKETRGWLSQGHQSKDQTSRGKGALTLCLEDESQLAFWRGQGTSFLLCGHNG